ncbi:malto-oligosyltrehalose trehalohydrolase [Chitinophaga sp.]|uniref:malto-oligosyltrehalose trehalohydrolase n=1 Tax=Chitinophaga sp. TaxID=1869181 RepID=UPI0031D35BA8
MRTSYTFTGSAILDNGAGLFSVWAPLRESVALSVLTPEPATIPMQKNDEGYWQVIVPDATPGMTYKYLLDGKIQRPDPASRYQPEGVHGPSALVANNFNWSDEGWQGLDLNKMIIYELHTGTFTPLQNFKGILSKLSYLRSLGINAIEIMPIAQFPGHRNWGYDGVFPYAVHNTYGTPNELKALVNAAHQYGIAMILDVVYNHLGPEGAYFSDFGPWYTEKYRTPWGAAINFDDQHSDGARAYYIRNALMWLEEYRIDGLRLDAVHAIWDSSAKHFTEELAEAVNALSHTTGRKKILIAEIDFNNPRYITQPDKGGYGMHGQWVDEFHHALHVVLTKEQDGYYEDFDGLPALARSWRDSYVYTGQYSRHRKRKFGVIPQGIPYDRFIVFTQNHDQVGNRVLGDRLMAQLPLEANKLAAALLLLSPHVPMLFMGEEYGEKKPFLYFTSFEDKALSKRVSEGRKHEFKTFSWTENVPDPQAESTFEQSILSWPAPGPLLEYYRYLIALRKTRRALLNTERDNIWVNMPQPGDVILSVERAGNDDRLLLLFNCSDRQAVFMHNRPHLLHKKFDSSVAIWQGPGPTAPDKVTADTAITLQPYSAIIYEII